MQIKIPRTTLKKIGQELKKLCDFAFRSRKKRKVSADDLLTT